MNIQAFLRSVSRALAALPPPTPGALVLFADNARSALVTSDWAVGQQLLLGAVKCGSEALAAAGWAGQWVVHVWLKSSRVGHNGWLLTLADGRFRMLTAADAVHIGSPFDMANAENN